GRWCGGWEGTVRAAPRRAAAVARLVRDDAEQPRLERRTCAEAAERAPRLDEPFLRRILGFARAAGDQKRSAICDRLVGVHELSVGVMVAASGALDQLRFVEWTALHYSGHTPLDTLRFRGLRRSASPTSRSRSATSTRRSRSGSDSSATWSCAVGSPA